MLDIKYIAVLKASIVICVQNFVGEVRRKGGGVVISEIVDGHANFLGFDRLQLANIYFIRFGNVEYIFSNVKELSVCNKL